MVGVSNRTTIFMPVLSVILFLSFFTAVRSLPYSFEHSFDLGKTFSPLSFRHSLTTGERQALTALVQQKPNQYVVRLVPGSRHPANFLRTSVPSCAVGPRKVLRFVVAVDDGGEPYAFWEEGSGCGEETFVNEGVAEAKGGKAEADEEMLVRVRQVRGIRSVKGTWRKFLRHKLDQEVKRVDDRGWSKWSLYLMGGLCLVLLNGIVKGCQSLIEEEEKEERLKREEALKKGGKGNLGRKKKGTRKRERRGDK